MEFEKESQKMRDIYGLVGHAIFLAQVLEGFLEQAVWMFIIFPKKKGEIVGVVNSQSIDEWHSFVEENDLSEKDRMLGRLLASIRGCGSISIDVLNSIDEARKCRNYIAHQYFKDNVSRLYVEKGRDAVIRSLGDICMKIKRAIDLIGPVVQCEMEKYGYDAEYVIEFSKNEIDRAASEFQ